MKPVLRSAWTDGEARFAGVKNKKRGQSESGKARKVRKARKVVKAECRSDVQN